MGQGLGTRPIGATGYLVIGAAVVALFVVTLKQIAEKARKPRPGWLPLRIEDDAVRGWVQVGVCIVTVALGTGLFASWVSTVWYRPPHVEFSFGVRRTRTVADARVEWIGRDVKTSGGHDILVLIVRYDDQMVTCEFREEQTPWGVQVGDTVRIRGSVRGGVREEGLMLLEDCEWAPER